MNKLLPGQRQDKMMAALVAKYLSLSDMDKDELAIRVHVSRTTMYSRIKHPGKMQLDEFRRLSKALGFSDEEKLSVI